MGRSVATLSAAVGLLLLGLAGLPSFGCGGAGSQPPGVIPPDPPQTAFSIADESGLLQGPAAEGRVWDYSLDNGVIQVIVQKPSRQAGLASFGGIPIDIARIGSDGKHSEDLFGLLLPLINLEWTVNYRDFTATGDTARGEPLVLTARGILDTYDYIDVGFIVPIAELLFGQRLSYPTRYNDRYEPFRFSALKSLSTTVTTEYIVPLGASYLEIRTTLHNNGPDAVNLPVGDLLAVSERLASTVAGQGAKTGSYFSRCPALIFSSTGADSISYGYAPPAELLISSSCVRTSGVSAVLQGDDLLGLVNGGPSRFSIAPGEGRSFSRFLFVGTGDIGSVLDPMLELLQIPGVEISGQALAGSVPAAGATITITEFDHPDRVVTSFASDAAGNFHGRLPRGDPDFGSGHYLVRVAKDGVGDTPCSPASIDLANLPNPAITCPLAARGTVAIGSVTDGDSGVRLEARLTVVHETRGVVAIRYLNAAGTLETGTSRRLTLDAGRYQFVVSRGPEYSIDRREVEVAAGRLTPFSASLKKIMPVDGLTSVDLHLHSTRSIDAAVTPEERVIHAAGEGLEALLSTDHDSLTDYGPIVRQLRAAGALAEADGANPVTTVVGDEVTPLAFGHFQVFPLAHDSASPNGGAPDYTLHASDVVGPEPDLVQTPADFFAGLRPAGGEPVIQVNHILDPISSYFGLIGLVTSPHFPGIPPLSTFATPIDLRLGPTSDPDGSAPFPPGTNPLLSMDFTAIELVTGNHLTTLSDLRRRALPVWFNLLNLGYRVTATASSDSHTLADPMGLPRNFVAGPADPQSLAKNINGHRVVMSTGPFVEVAAGHENGGEPVGVGETIKGDPISLKIAARSPAWAPFDRVEVFVNTDPIPAADSITDPSQAVPFKGGALDFFAVGHLGNYSYRPFFQQNVIPVDDGNGVLVWESDPIRVSVARDAWVVVLVYGSDAVVPLYPIAPVLGCLPAAIPAESGTTAPTDVCLPDDPFAPSTGPRAWALTNPIFIDADADGTLTPLYK